MKNVREWITCRTLIADNDSARCNEILNNDVSLPEDQAGRCLLDSASI